MSFVAVSRVDYPPHLEREVHAAGLEMLPIARCQNGLVSVAFHCSDSKNQTMMYWEWCTQAHHEACMQSSDWGAVMKKYASVFSEEGVAFSIETFQRLA